ncbi:site-specific DNA-methyltransferase [Bradyrhizobium sp. 61]|uniref:site-specific DNA-methyltransferase n=1 Tax=Bradyrhizobium sp. 61 TaxID=2782679 RepID=UPI001FFA0C7D|nr:site-specific DNA-methyltransferase [Bradyrhizobium sp. 61]MCK1281799.1 site-specific DNA-methyltransferase [Bradyrhizobium sp. 61]
MARLTEQEQQDIIRFVEADKPLPEKYRFLLFEDKREVELVWNGKTNEVCNVVLPFQTIEQVDEPRAEKPEDTAAQQDLFSTDSRGRQLKGWTNKLIWGDNKLILSSLKNGPLRQEIERQGGIKLIYIDPPFDVGADFSMDIEIGGDTFTKKPNILEEIAYRDTWGKGADSFISMIYERLLLSRDLLTDDGNIFVHCDWRVSGYMRSALDEVFGTENFRNEIIWKRRVGMSSAVHESNQFGVCTDTILFYAKSDRSVFFPQYNKDSPEYQEYIRTRFTNIDKDGRLYQPTSLVNPAYRPNLIYDYKGYKSPPNGWMITKDKMELWDKEGKLHFPENAESRIRRKSFADELKGMPVQNLWTDIYEINSQAEERIDYPTQKPEALIERVIRSCSAEGDLVADFFVGSGTTSAIAEKLGRKWIVSDLGKFAVHTTRKRMIGVQRGLKAEGKNYRAFEILNLGRYERQHYVGVNPNLREGQRQKQLEEKEAAFLDLILRAYRAERTDGFASFHGKKAGRLVAIGPVNMPVSRLFVEEIILECRKKHITKVDILGFEFEMGLFPNVLDEARAKGIDIAPKYIPADVFDKRAVEKNQVVFHDVSFIEIKPHVKRDSVAVELTDFSVFYSQDSIANAEATLKDKGSKIVVEKGQIVKVTKDKNGIVTREPLTQSWTDWIDYWSVDFDFENKREIIRTQNPDTGEWEESWTGDYIFENEWQSFRTKKNRKLELTSVFHECPPGRRKVAVKVVDIFGNDTMTIAEVTVGGKK